MNPDYKYTDNDSLDKISQDPRLRDEKYGGISTKTVPILCNENGKHYIYHASSSLVEMLKRKYGNISFKDAYRLWKEKK